MKIFVISLLRSQERRQIISKALDAASFEWEFFDAVDGTLNSHLPIFNLYDNELALRTRAKKLSKGELGCYASHYLLWERCYASKEPCIILEDDAIIDIKLFAEFIKYADSMHYDWVRLHQNFRKKVVSIPLKQSNNKLSLYSKGHLSTVGYYITPTGASALLQQSHAWYLPVDLMMDRYWLHGLWPVGLTVPAVKPDLDNVSTIPGRGQQTKLNIYQRLRKELNNAVNNVRRLICFASIYLQVIVK